MTNLLPSACWTRSNKADSKSIFPKEILRLTRASVLAYKSCETRTLLEVDRAGFEPATSALRMQRSYQAELSAQNLFSEEKLHQNI